MIKNNKKWAVLGLAVVFAFVGFAKVKAMTPQVFSDNFGSTNLSDIPNWDELGVDSTTSTVVTSGNESEDIPNSDATSLTPQFAKIGAGDWICTQVDGTQYKNMNLSFQMRGDQDAKNGDLGILEVRVGGSCTSTSSWTNVVSYSLKNFKATNGSWSGAQTRDLPALTNFQNFFVRFRNTASVADTHFRVDDVIVEGSWDETVGFHLINADTDHLIGDLVEGSTWRIGDFGTNNLSIQAQMNNTSIGSVQFAYDGNTNYFVDNQSPWAIAGNNPANPNDYLAWNPTVGTHTVTATPYSGANATGHAGLPFTLHFTVNP